MEKLTDNSTHPRPAFGAGVYGNLPCQPLLIFPAALAPGRTNIYIPGFSDCFHVEPLSKELFMWFQGLAINFHFQLDPAFLQGFKVGDGFVLGMRAWIGTAQGVGMSHSCFI